jgi:hypothetical protein
MYGHSTGRLLRLAAISFVTVCLIAAAAGQVQVGENLKMNLNGILGVGYGGDFGNAPGLSSSHHVFLQGQGTLSGSYYDPRFLSFTVEPFYNRNQDNATFASVFNESGLTASANFFSGSHFPGSVYYGDVWTDGNQYGLAPGVPGVASNNATQTFGVSWSALFKGWPTLTASFSDSSQSDQILGESGAVDSSIKSINLLSNYSIARWSFSGNFVHQNFRSTFPEFLGGSSSNSGSNSYSVSANHSLPWNGTFSAAYYHTAYNTVSDSIENSGNADTITGGFAMAPTDKFSFGGNARYYTNLVGALQNTFLPPGTVPITPINSQTNGYVVNGYASYALGHGFGIVAYGGRGVQQFEGEQFVSKQYGATLTYRYSKPLLGMLYFNFGMVNTAGDANTGDLAFVGSVGLKKQLGAWDVNADVSYSQGVQNSVAWFTSSNYNYGAFVRRRFGEWIYWTVSARDVRTGLTQFSGYDTNSQTFSTSVIRKSIGLSAAYSQSHGVSILTSSGALVPSPPVPGLFPGEVFYNATSYGGTFSIVPVRRMQISASWYRVNSQTTSFPAETSPGVLPPPIYSTNSSNRIYAVMNYKVRKLDFLATYWRINQDISFTGLPRAIDNSYSFTISRWFNVF